MASHYPAFSSCSEPETRPNPGMGSIGKTDSDGLYSLRQIQPDRPGAVIGAHRVTIRMPAGITHPPAKNPSRFLSA